MTRMYSIGDLSARTGVKVPTIRYYEEAGLLANAGRTAGNQRRYDAAGLARLGFIRHARDLGFPLAAIQSLIALQDHPDRSCAEANAIATDRLRDVQARIARLRRLEAELKRVADSCDAPGPAGDCHVLASLADHDLCEGGH